MSDFNLRAKEWDTDKRMERSKVIAEKISSYIPNDNGYSAMEFGCGTGLVGMQLIDRFSSMIFMDSSHGMIEQVNQKISSINKPMLSAICYNLVTDMPQNLKVDYIFTSMALHHIKDIMIILSRFFDLLNPNGHIFIVDLDKDDGSFHANDPDFDGHDGFEHSELIELCKNTGFTKVDIQTFYQDYRIVNEKEVTYSLFLLNAKK